MSYTQLANKVKDWISTIKLGFLEALKGIDQDERTLKKAHDGFLAGTITKVYGDMSRGWAIGSFSSLVLDWISDCKVFLM